MSTLIEQQTAVPAGTWQADSVHSSVGFEVAYLGISTFSGEFSGFEATLADGNLSGKAPVSNIEVKDENLKAHLQAPDFFDAERYPELRFASTELSVGEDGSARLRGELEIRGEKREVEASGRFGQIGADLGGNARVGLSFAATVDRRNFGLDWQAELPSGGEVLDYAVSIAVELELVREAE
jgi:polyisoprenoid-binding protein YceI